MEVAISAFRAELKTWVARARDGEQILITERGIPVARLAPVEGADLIERLERDGLLAPPQAAERAPAPARPPSLEPDQAQSQPSGVAGLVRRLRR
jgi:prevent-host-death family protein